MAIFQKKIQQQIKVLKIFQKTNGLEKNGKNENKKNAK